jgi:hypothetical protein
MNNKWIKYENGNYTVKLNLENGTKIRETEDDEFISTFPECIDLKITNQCDMGCKYCHEDSTIDGLHGDVLNSEFINTLKPYTELALGGGNVLTHPNLIEFLEVLKSKNIIANITVNQKHFISSKNTIRYLVDNGLIKGLGVSLLTPTDEFVELIKQYPNAVIHVINGIVSIEDLEKLYNKNLKLLILGYKVFRRGKDYYSTTVERNKQVVYDKICDIIKGFKVVSFDNLAIKQIDVRRIFTNQGWNEFYMGDDGQFTMYIDLVKRQFARSSISTQRYNLLDSIEDMFSVVKNEEN